MAATVSFSQYNSVIQTGRPGQSIGSGVVGRGVLQVQSGFDHNWSETNGRKVLSRTNNNIVRFGFNDRFEISSIVDLNHETVSPSNGPQSTREGLSQTQLGFRNVVFREADNEYVPGLAVQTRFRFSSDSRKYPIAQTFPVFLLAMTKSLDPTWSLTSNLGLKYNAGSADPVHSFTFAVSQSLSDSCSLLYEAYGQESQGQSSHYGGVGFSYLTNPDFQWDSYVSYGDNLGNQEIYLSLGFSWRSRLFE